MSKIVNFKIEENATFTKALQFTKEVKVSETTNAITGKPVAVYKRVPLSLEGYTIAAQVKSSLLDDAAIIAVFEAKMLNASDGLAYLALTKEQTSALEKYVSASPLGVSSDRVLLLGYYDVLVTSSLGVATRVFQGKCYLSKAATQNPLITVGDNGTVVTKGPLNPITSITDLAVDKTKAHYYVGIRYYNGEVQVTPTSGTVDIYRMPDTSNTFQANPVGILLANSPASELAWHSNTSRVRANPNNVAGATAYQLVVVSNVS